MQNFITLGQPFLGEKYVTQKEEEKKNNPKNSGHYIPLRRPRAAHAICLDQFSNKQYTISHVMLYLNWFQTVTSKLKGSYMSS